MKKYLKWTLLISFAFIFLTCGYFLIAPKNSGEMFKLTAAEEGSNYATVSLNGDLTLYDSFGVQSAAEGFDNPWIFCNYYTANQIVIDVVCLNYVDYQAFTNNTYNATLEILDEVSTYFYLQSKGYLTMKFNVYIANSTESTETAFARTRNYAYDRAMFERYKNNAGEVLTSYGTSQAAMIIHSSKNSPKEKAINYPHTAISLYETPFISLNSGAALSTYFHEIYHALGLFDLYTGKCEIAKAGASTTFIKRENQVEGIRSTSLPLGVVAKLEVDQVEAQLQDGDYIVMVTDGVMDALPVGEQDLIMKMIIEGTSSQNPKEMAHHILEQVLTCSGEVPLDDMTVLVVGIWSLEK